MIFEEKKKVVFCVCIIGGKVVFGYEIVKKIIKFVIIIGEWINDDSDIGNFLKVVSKFVVWIFIC